MRTIRVVPFGGGDVLDQDRLSTQLAAVVACLSMTTGCLENVSREDARLAWNTAEELILDAEPRARAADVNRGKIVEYDEDCAGGGTLTFSGTRQNIGSDTMEIIYLVTIDDCAPGGLNIDGTLTFSVLARPETHQGERTVLTFHGELDFDDVVAGTCDTALVARSDQPYASRTLRDNLRFEGTHCEYDATELFDRSSSE